MRLTRWRTSEAGLPRSGLGSKLAKLTKPTDGARRSSIWLELVVIVWLLWIYDAVDNLAPLRLAMARHDASDVLRVERVLHLDPEASMDRWLSNKHALASLISNYYDNAHFVVTFALVIALWLKWPSLYRPLRNNLVLINVIGMAIFWLFPTAPPRLLDPAVYSDVVANTHAFGSWHTGALASAANQLAAMPSLHISWACWCSLAGWRLLKGRRFAPAVWIYPVITGLAVLSTGNHWFLDVVAGFATFVVATVVSDRWQGWWTARQAQRALRRRSDGPRRLIRR